MDTVVGVPVVPFTDVILGTIVTLSALQKPQDVIIKPNLDHLIGQKQTKES